MVSTCTDAEHLSHVPIEAGSIVTAEEIRQSLKGVELDKPYLCMLVLISTVWAQWTKRALTRALIGGAQPVEGWWAPVVQHTYKRKRWGRQWQVVQSSSPFAPPTETLADQGCAEATGSATSSPSSPGDHGTVRRHPCASHRRPCHRHCYISPAPRLRHPSTAAPWQAVTVVTERYSSM